MSQDQTTPKRDRPLYSGVRVQHMDAVWLRCALQGVREYMAAWPQAVPAYASQAAVYRAELRRRGLEATRAPFGFAT